MNLSKVFLANLMIVGLVAWSTAVANGNNNDDDKDYTSSESEYSSESTESSASQPSEMSDESTADKSVSQSKEMSPESSQDSWSRQQRLSRERSFRTERGFREQPRRFYRAPRRAEIYGYEETGPAEQETIITTEEPATTCKTHSHLFHAHKHTHCERVATTCEPCAERRVVSRCEVDEPKCPKRTCSLCSWLSGKCAKRETCERCAEATPNYSVYGYVNSHCSTCD